MRGRFPESLPNCGLKTLPCIKFPADFNAGFEIPKISKFRARETEKTPIFMK